MTEEGQTKDELDKASCLQTAWEPCERSAVPSDAHLPPDSLQLGQVQATLRSRLPSPPAVSMSSSPMGTRRLFRSLGFSVESPLSCHSSESGSSFI